MSLSPYTWEFPDEPRYGYLKPASKSRNWALGNLPLLELLCYRKKSDPKRPAGLGVPGVAFCSPRSLMQNMWLEYEMCSLPVHNLPSKWEDPSYLFWERFNPFTFPVLFSCYKGLGFQKTKHWFLYPSNLLVTQAQRISETKPPQDLLKRSLI